MECPYPPSPGSSLPQLADPCVAAAGGGEQPWGCLLHGEGVSPRYGGVREMRLLERSKARGVLLRQGR